jgi:hypothetical protein
MRMMVLSFFVFPSQWFFKIIDGMNWEPLHFNLGRPRPLPISFTVFGLIIVLYAWLCPQDMGVFYKKQLLAVSH